MGKKNFKQEEICGLKDNQYVAAVSRSTITYTDTFKELFLNYRNEGMMPKEIFMKLGLDPEMLGQQRIDSLDKRLRKKSEAGESLKDQRKGHSGRREKKDTENMSDKERIAYLESELEYYKQTNEFIKKNLEIREKYMSRRKK